LMMFMIVLISAITLHLGHYLNLTLLTVILKHTL
jgi:hypothetical protein